MNEALAAKLKDLHLSELLTHWDDYLKLAGDQRFSHGRLLTHIVEEQYRVKREHLRELRLRKAHVPEPWVIETFPFDRQPKLNETQSQNIVWLGGTGVGKSGLATSFLIHAINQGYSGRYVLFAELLAQFYQSCADHSEAKLLSKYLSYDCLLIDEIGYVEVEAVQVGLFFTLMHKRHRKKPTLITSNLGFSEWGSFLKNTHLTAALIDRLTENSHVINMKQCVSLRPKLSSES
jgi:DNA replication protein DnaC